MKKTDVLHFKSLFPLNGIVTQDIIDTADIDDIHNCIGAKTLKLALPKKFHKYIVWGSSFSFINLGDKRFTFNDDENFTWVQSLNADTETPLNLIDVTEPIEVNFVLY